MISQFGVLSRESRPGDCAGGLDGCGGPVPDGELGVWPPGP